MGETRETGAGGAVELDEDDDGLRWYCSDHGACREAMCPTCGDGTAGPDAVAATCGACGRRWDADRFPTPAGRCPWEHMHEEPVAAAGEHVCMWGPGELSRFSGTVHRKCTASYCDRITLDFDEEPAGPVAAVRVTVHEDPAADLSWLAQECWNEPFTRADGTLEPAGWGCRRIREHGDTWWTVGVEVATLCPHGGEIDAASMWGIDADGTPKSIDYIAAIVGDLAGELAGVDAARVATLARPDLDDEPCQVTLTAEELEGWGL